MDTVEEDTHCSTIRPEESQFAPYRHIRNGTIEGIHHSIQHHLRYRMPNNTHRLRSQKKTPRISC